MNSNYSNYTVQLSNDATYYGTDCTQELANEIVKNLSRMIQSEFPGITVEVWREGEKSSATTGPELSIVEQIDAWIAENWTAAI